jgi:lambda family phage minor tail protein L
LYELDLTMFDLGIIRLAPGTTGSPASAVGYGGETYAPHPIDAEGFELSTNGPLPRPTFAVGNLDNSFTAIVEAHDDLQGGILTRIRTYARYLDDGAEPDGDVHLPLDVYLLSQKVKHTQMVIQWECSAMMDQQGVMLPGRTVSRDFCDHTTRRWTGSAFDYTNVTCPWVGAAKDENGDACASAAEVFSKRLGTCCQARFGTAAVLPTRAFPGVARIRAR